MKEEANLEEDDIELLLMEESIREKLIKPKSIQMLIILLKNPNLTLKEMNNFIPVHYKTLVRWWKYYKEEDLGRLLEWNLEGQRGKKKGLKKNLKI